MKRIEKDWTNVISESLIQKDGELKLSYEPGNATLEVISDKMGTIEVKVEPDGSLELSFEDGGEVRVMMDDFLENVVEELNTEFGYQLDIEDYQDGNLLKSLIMLKQSLLKNIP